MTANYQNITQVPDSLRDNGFPLPKISGVFLNHAEDNLDWILDDVYRVLGGKSALHASAAPTKWTETRDAFIMTAPKEPLLSPVSVDRRPLDSLFDFSHSGLWIPDYHGRGYLLVGRSDTQESLDEFEVSVVRRLWLARAAPAQAPPIRFCQGQLELAVNNIDTLFHITGTTDMGSSDEDFTLYGSPQIREDVLFKQLLFFSPEGVHNSTVPQKERSVGFADSGFQDIPDISPPQ
jgi:hypothetical protein